MIEALALLFLLFILLLLVPHAGVRRTRQGGAALQNSAQVNPYCQPPPEGSRDPYSPNYMHRRSENG